MLCLFIGLFTHELMFETSRNFSEKRPDLAHHDLSAAQISGARAQRESSTWFSDSGAGI